MDLKALIVLFVCFTIVGSASKNVRKLVDVVAFGLKIIKTIDGLISGDSSDSVDLDRLIRTVTARIDASNTEIIRTINLQSREERLEDAVINIQSSLTDLKHVLQASNSVEREEYKRLFVARFEEHDLITHLRSLSNLLEFNIPGSTGQLIDLLAENTRCNMTAINDFRLFYNELISDGVTLNLIFLKWSTNLSINTTIDEWRNHFVNIAQIFENKIKYCKTKFAVYTKEDVQNAKNALKLWTDNNERYTWKIQDVIFSKPYGTFQFLYYSHCGDSLFWHRSTEYNKFAIFSDKNESRQVSFNSNVLSHCQESIEGSIQGEDDTDAAKNVGNAFEKCIKDLGYVTENLVVAFDGGEFSKEEIILDTDSPVLELSVNNTKLSYCYKSGFECTMDPLNWFDVKKTVQGQMRVFAYVTNATESMSQLSRQTGNSPRIQPLTLLVYFLVFACIKINKT